MKNRSFLFRRVYDLYFHFSNFWAYIHSPLADSINTFFHMIFGNHFDMFKGENEALSVAE